MNCCVVPKGIEALAGLIATDTNVDCPTVRFVDAKTTPEFKVMLAVPMPALVATPLVPTALLTIATGGEDELHVTSEVTSCVLPSA